MYIHWCCMDLFTYTCTEQLNKNFPRDIISTLSFRVEQMNSRFAF